MIFSVDNDNRKIVALRKQSSIKFKYSFNLKSKDKNTYASSSFNMMIVYENIKC